MSRKAIAAFTVALSFNLLVSQADAAGPPGETGHPTLVEAKTLIDTGEYEKALALLTPMADANPDNADAFNLIGFASRKSGDLDRAGTAYERALQLDPVHLGALEYQGELFLTLGSIQKAEANLARLATLCPAGCEEADDLAEAITEWRKRQN